MTFLSLTTWSLHRSLGPLRMTHWDATLRTQVTKEVAQPAVTDLLALPAIAAAHGIGALDICHFHFPDTSDSYVESLRAACADAGITFFTLLVDYGDISSADDVRRSSDIAYIKGWIDIAAKAGATRVRVVAGESAPSDLAGLRRSAAALQELIAYAQARGVKVVSENFKTLTSTADPCVYLHGACDERLRFICDFGNFTGTQKYDEFSQILPFADAVHAKAQYDRDGIPDSDEFALCMARVDPAFSGPFTIVYDGPGDEWAGIERVKSLILAARA